MTKLLTKILLRQNVGTIVRLLITLKKYYIFYNLAKNLKKLIFLNKLNQIKFTLLEFDQFNKKGFIHVWFNINNDIDIEFLSNIFYSIETIESIKNYTHRIYLSTVSVDGDMYSVGSSSLTASITTVVEFVEYILKMLNDLDPKAYPIDQFEFFIVKIKKPIINE
jgi:hypothetical protein